MERIDAHQHFWNYDAVTHSWITDEMAMLRRDFLPPDLAPLLAGNNFDGSVAVQADQTLEETYFLLQLAKENPFIRGVVGWVDLQAPGVGDQLASLKQFEKLKGFRHILQGEPDNAFMLRSAFLNGIKELGNYHFTYDILVFPGHLENVRKLVQQFPEQSFVIDHLAKPGIKNGEIKEWEKDMRSLAACSNVCCKLSGMVTEANWKHWKKEDIYPYIDVIIESFDTGRVMFGSDWPVCLVAGSYQQVTGIVDDYIAGFSRDEKNKIFGENAISFYNL
jgi:L-fuconolactonase